VDVTFLQELEALFERRWTPYILLCLIDGPQRFSTIAKTINAQSTDHFADGVLTNTLSYLQTAGLAQPVTGQGHGRYRPYTLTPAGYTVAARLVRIRKALTDDDTPPPDGQPSGP